MRVLSIPPSAWTLLGPKLRLLRGIVAIHLDNAVFTKLGSGSADSPKALKSKYFKLSTQAQDKDDCVVYNKGTGVLYYDSNGASSGGRTEIAKFSNKPGLKASEFFVI
jgi:serralysin